MNTRNVTVSLPVQLLRRVKIAAARRETSISALLTTSLERLVREDEGRAAAARRLIARARHGYDLGTGGHVGLSRAELHER